MRIGEALVRVGVVLFLAMISSLASLAFAQEADLKLKELVKPEHPISKRVLLVVDVSYSMRVHVRTVMRFVRTILKQPLDEAEFGVITFDHGFSRWPGIPESDGPRPVPYGWARLPSEEAVDLAEKWTRSTSRGGGTFPASAVALALGEARTGLSIVLVTDGEFVYGPVKEAIEAGQARRKEGGLGEAVIATFALVPHERGRWVDDLKDVAKIGRGGLWMPLEREPDDSCGIIFQGAAPISTRTR